MQAALAKDVLPIKYTGNGKEKGDKLNMHYRDKYIRHWKKYLSAGVLRK